MKKLLSSLLVLVMVFAMAVPVMALDREGITKKEYDAFSDKLSANNSVTDVGNGLTLRSNSKTGWWIVADEGVFGTVEVAYKIGKAYYLVSFEIRKESREYFIGDGSGKNGVNHVKIGEFVPHECGNEWELIESKKATCATEGYEKYECTWCGNTKTDDLPLDPNNHEKPVTCEVCNVCDACGVCTCAAEEPEEPKFTAKAYAYKGDKNNNILHIDVYEGDEVVASYKGEYDQSEADGFTRDVEGYTVLVVVNGRGGGSGSDENYLAYPLDGTATVIGWPEE